MSPIYVSTACLSGQEPLQVRLSRFFASGFQNVELGASVSVTPESLDSLPSFGGNFLVHNYFPPPEDSFVLNLASRDKTIRKRSGDLIRQALTLCAEIGAPFYSLHGGFITDPTGFGSHSFVFPLPESANERNLAMTRFITEIQIILEYARSLGVDILVENNVCDLSLVDRLLFVEAQDFLTLKRDLSTTHLGILLDTGHLNVSAHTLGFDRMEFVAQIAPYVRALHVHDNNGLADEHRQIQPDSWVLDVLRCPEFAGLPIVLESKFSVFPELLKHVRWLEQELNNKPLA